MKIRLQPLAVLLCLSGFIAAPVMAAVTTDSNLAQQVASLEKEVNALKKQMHHSTKKTASAASSNSSGTLIQRKQSTTDTPITTTAEVPSSVTGQNLAKIISESRQYLPFDLDVPGQAFVSSGPYIGVPIQYAGTNLIINSPSVNTDVQLLGIRKNILTQLNALGNEIKIPEHSHVLLSGVVESQANYTNQGGGPSTTDIDVTNVALDTTIFGPSQWILGFIELEYDNSPPIDNGVFVSTSNYRVSNSRVLVNKAFVTLGNFNCSPFYSSFGQFYVPFGTYSSSMISDPLTKLLGRTKARSILVGFQQQDKNAFYGAAYIFRGDSHAASVAKVNNGGINLGYKFSEGFLSGNVGGGVIGNISDSGGMQLGNNFANFEQLDHRVPGYDLRGTLSLGEHIDLLGEFVTASTHYNINDMSYNNNGAKPSAFDLEADYSFSILDNKPSSVGIGYGKSTQALSLGIPMSRTTVVFNTSLLRNTLQSLEFRHDREYAASSVATGAGGFASPSQTGKADNAITALFDYYF